MHREVLDAHEDVDFRAMTLAHCPEPLQRKRSDTSTVSTHAPALALRRCSATTPNVCPRPHHSKVRSPVRVTSSISQVSDVELDRAVMRVRTWVTVPGNTISTVLYPEVV